MTVPVFPVLTAGTTAQDQKVCGIPMTTITPAVDLSEAQFTSVAQLLHERAGIALRPGKEQLVKARLSRRMRELGIRSVEAYLDYLERDKTGHEMAAMIDVLTTNKTSFFREQEHFEFLKDRVLPSLRRRDGIRAWSAGCSSGEEPFSVAMLLREELSDIDRWDARVLATDISSTVLEKARAGVYDTRAVEGVPDALRRKYFARVRTDEGAEYRISESVRGMVRFARLNLMGSWPMRGAFDVILCRNVMIYFDRPTRETLVRRYWELLRPEGHLLVGHSESLNGLDHPFSYVQPAVYVK